MSTAAVHAGRLYGGQSYDRTSINGQNVPKQEKQTAVQQPPESAVRVTLSDEGRARSQAYVDYIDAAQKGRQTIMQVHDGAAEEKTIDTYVFDRYDAEGNERMDRRLSADETFDLLRDLAEQHQDDGGIGAMVSGDGLASWQEIVDRDTEQHGGVSWQERMAQEIAARNAAIGSVGTPLEPRATVQLTPEQQAEADRRNRRLGDEYQEMMRFYDPDAYQAYQDELSAAQASGDRDQIGHAITRPFKWAYDHGAFREDGALRTDYARQKEAQNKLLDRHADTDVVAADATDPAAAHYLQRTKYAMFLAPDLLKTLANGNSADREALAQTLDQVMESLRGVGERAADGWRFRAAIGADQSVLYTAANGGRNLSAGSAEELLKAIAG